MSTLEDFVEIVQCLGTATSVCKLNNLDAIVELYLDEIQGLDFILN